MTEKKIIFSPNQFVTNTIKGPALYTRRYVNILCDIVLKYESKRIQIVLLLNENHICILNYGRFLCVGISRSFFIRIDRLKKNNLNFISKGYDKRIIM